MSDDNKPYVDPNSGAAPQPGGYAGAEAADKGFAIPADYEVTEEPKVTEYEAPGGPGLTKSVDEMLEKNPPAKKSEEQEKKYEVVTNPKKVLADLDESEDSKPVDDIDHTEEEGSNAAALEHDAVDVTTPVGEDETPVEEGKAPAKKTAAKRTSARKS